MSGRPPLGVRVAIGVLALAGFAFMGLLMLADRAPGFLRRTFGSQVNRLWDRIDAAGAPRELTQGARDHPDFFVHVIVWGVVTMLAALTVWTVRGVALVTGAALATSAVVEWAQGQFTHSRAVQSSDVLGNALGVGTGAIAALFVIGMGWLVAGARGQAR